MASGVDCRDIRLRIHGVFVQKNHKGKRISVYEGGWVYWKMKARLTDITVEYLRHSCVEGFVYADKPVPHMFNIWYKEIGKTWAFGRREIVNEEQVRGFLEAVHEDGHLELFCTVQLSNEPITQTQEQITTHSTKQPQKKPENQPLIRRSPRFKKPTEPKDNPKKHQLLEHHPLLRRSPRFKKNKSEGVDRSGGIHATVKGKGKQKLIEKVGDETVRVKQKGKGKRKARRKLFSDVDSRSGSSSLEYTDLEINWEIGEEEGHLSDEEIYDTGPLLIDEVNRSLDVDYYKGKGDESEEEAANKAARLSQLIKDIGYEEQKIQEEVDGDSDDLRSLHGSDEEEDSSPWFKEDTDFKQEIVLVNKLKFTNINVLRRALRTHAIENRYEYYYLHNGGERITTFCKRRCACEWNSKRSNLPLCQCPESVKRCDYKVHARKLFNSSTWQIKTLKLKHSCVRSRMNSKVTAEYLAEKYLEEWRSNPTWRIKSFRYKVLTDLGICIGYSKAWLARARAKFMIYGSAAEQYARVWDYGKAIIKYNPGSGCCVVVDGIEQPEPPLFLRLYVCLAPLRDGFLKGCRPLIGVDGCHLKGSYPGQILVAVGKDGNNNIFPFAWATVEVENKDSWVWFLELIMRDLDGFDGSGWTFMSDRQKGLLEAFELVVPKAEKRFCVRHIWANFKLQFSGDTFKELFWNAARATTLFDFEVAMESIKFLSEDAFEYLDNIPTQHWSRHAFSTNCKSNMLLNNICETFNAVIKDARDKPILTQMEWMRRYMMKRNSDKWEAVLKMDGKIMPYVTKVFQGLEKAARYCIVQVSRGDTYEVELNGDQVLVDLGQRSCSCYHWQLTGIPCVHAFACMMDKRLDPVDFVDHAYSRDTYMLAYEDAIQPMPGPKYWDKVQLREPHPPSVRVMPSRPKSKKRKLEKGESSSGPIDKLPKMPEQLKPKKHKQCRNCGQYGHYAKTCGNASVVIPPPPLIASSEPSEPNKGGRPPLLTAWVNDQRKNKEKRAVRVQAEGAGPLSTANRKFPQEKSQLAAQGQNCSQASSTITTVSTKKQTKPKSNKK